jgi:Yip1 domain
MSLVERAKSILQKPKETWPVIEAEKDTTATLYLDYAVMLAAIPPVATFVGACMTGYVGYRVPIVTGAIWAVVGYVLSLATIYLSAFIIDALAGVFGGQRNFNKAMKVAVYAPTAFWLAAIFNVQPPMAFLSLMGLYSFYLLYTGLAALMKAPADKVLTYTIATVACVAVLWIVLVGVPVLVLTRF